MISKRYLLLVVLLLLMILASGCCLGKDMFKKKPKSNHFASNEISFNYPKGWKPISDIFPQFEPRQDRMLSAQEICGFVDPKSASPPPYREKFTIWVMIEKKAIPSGSTLKNVYESTYKSTYAELSEVSERTTRVSRRTAYEKIYKMPYADFYLKKREVWLEKNGIIYIISCRAHPGSFEKAQPDFDVIIKSFHLN